MMIRALMCVLCLVAGVASAHEVRPAVGDLYIEGDSLRLELQMSAEALVAGVNLDGLSDTNNSDQAAAYDAARALPPDALAADIRALFPDVQAILRLSADGTPVPLDLDAVEVGPVGNVELPRDTTLTLRADLPADTEAVALAWPRGYGAVILRQQGVAEPYTGYLSGGDDSGPIPVAGTPAAGWGATFAQYIPVGFDHILPKGLDHILFVLGLFFLAPALRPLLIQVSLFTLAHTVTLALGALQIVTIPGSIVEPLIALSIVYVAVENLFTDGLNRWRPLIIFGFGLLHGLGFASVLGEFGLPPGQFVAALIGFNVGVEIGQLVVIAVAWALVALALSRAGEGEEGRPYAALYLLAAMIVVPALWFGATLMPDWPMDDLVPLFIAAAVLLGLSAGAVVSWDTDAYRRSVAIPASVGIGLVGMWWVIERVLL